MEGDFRRTFLSVAAARLADRLRRALAPYLEQEEQDKDANGMMQHFRSIFESALEIKSVQMLIENPSEFVYLSSGHTLENALRDENREQVVTESSSSDRRGITYTIVSGLRAHGRRGQCSSSSAQGKMNGSRDHDTYWITRPMVI